eukprot:2737999-Lingulodinium_polyedra.AAC.1
MPSRARRSRGHRAPSRGGRAPHSKPPCPTARAPQAPWPAMADNLVTVESIAELITVRVA